MDRMSSDNEEASTEAASWMSQYEYRKLFGLSWKEYSEEPYSVWLMNNIIHSLKAQRENKKK
jgi:hypothetical protein